MTSWTSTLRRTVMQGAYAVAPKLTAQKAFEHYHRGGRFEPELYLIPAFGDRAACAFDVGANKGFYAIAMAREFAEVVAFEPNPAIFAKLAARVPSNVACRREALSDRTGTTVLRVPTDAGRATIEGANALGAHANGLSTYDVPLARLDDVPRKQRVGLMKIDVEGHEHAVLRGAGAILRDDRPCLIIESENRHRPDAVQDLRAMLREAGYAGFMLWKQRLHSVEGFAATTHQPLDARGEPSGDYVANFLFFPDEIAEATAAAVSARLAVLPVRA